MKHIIAVLAGAAALAAGSAAHADIALTGEVGTTGIGFHASVPLRPNLHARIGFGYLGYSYSGSSSGLDYDLSLKARTYDALLDWYPRADSSFRVTAGVAYNGNKIDAQARPDAAGNYVVQGNAYSAATVGKVNGTVDFGKLAPYLGIGWSKRLSQDEKGWSFSTDVGVMFQGSPRTTLTSSGCTAAAPVCSQLSADLARQNAALSDDMRRFKVYPVLRVGVSYRF
jgi:hypothetical protein